MNTLERFTKLFIFVAIWVPALWAMNAKVSQVLGVIIALASFAATIGYMFMLKDLAKFEEVKKGKPWL